MKDSIRKMEERFWELPEDVKKEVRVYRDAYWKLMDLTQGLLDEFRKLKIQIEEEKMNEGGV